MRRRAVLVSIDRIQEGDSSSIRDAALAHLDELYRFAVRMTRHAEGARDIVQESVLRALEHERSAVGNPRAWLFQILYHTFITHHRRDEQRRNSDEGSSRKQPEDVVDPLPTFIAIEDVRVAVEDLPEDFRTVVWLSDAEQFSLREIAEILGRPLGTVASRLARGRQELRRLLSAYGPPGEK